MIDPLRNPKLFHAIEAVLDVALRHPDPVNSADIADRAGVDRRYLEQQLRTLANEGILTSKRGPVSGGYRLAHPPNLISLGEVVRAIRSLDAPPADPAHSPLALLVVGPVLREVAKAEIIALELITFESLCAIARQATKNAGECAA
jgi:Rrf2 family protein